MGIAIPAKTVVALVIAFIALAPQSPAWAGGGPVPVTLQLLWTHQGYFGGYYVADRKGFYAKEGLSVRFLEGGPKADPISPVLDGRAEFGIAAAADLIIARANGKPVRAVATIFRRTATVYVSRADSGITRPIDFKGKTVRVSTVDAASFNAVMARVGIKPTEYRLVNLPSDVAVFASGAADVWAAYINNFVVTLEESGQKLNYIYPDDYGVHFYGDTLFTTDKVVADKPDLVLGFLRASLKGWDLAVDDPPLVGALVHLYDPTADAAIETLKMRATQTLVNTGEDHIGWMSERRWAQMANILHEQGTLAEPMNPNDLLTPAFLVKIYGANPLPH
jgi:NitT/TauT family transport system substrate-binding protein